LDLTTMPHTAVWEGLDPAEAGSARPTVAAAAAAAAKTATPDPGRLSTLHNYWVQYFWQNVFPPSFWTLAWAFLTSGCTRGLRFITAA